ncbi:MAG: cysteine desulfurase [Candidatus Doudnabacteria bacterium]|nr:cysteine desulfurase [Candidatus Doudnabacteria bacterium]
MKRIYLDNAATTPIDPRVSKAMRDFELEFYGNPSSIHREGQVARAKIDSARANIAAFLNCKAQEIIFTSGATEANNLAIQGVISHALLDLAVKPHVITTMLEHQSVYNLIKELEEREVIEATFIKPDKNGLIDPDDVIRAIKSNTVLISVIFVSNEIGSILPIREIGKALSSLPPTTYNLKPLFHTDAVQAAKFCNLNVEKLGVDLLTLSGHKINGPKGIGALYIKSGTKIRPLIFGGSQEYEKRPGTQNTAGIIGIAKAYNLLGSLENRQKNAEKISRLRDELLEFLSNQKRVEINGPMGDNRTADNISFTILGADQELIISKLDLAGIAASTGSACVSGSTKPSHVIHALGKVGKKPAATVRLSLCRQNTQDEIKQVIKVLTRILQGTVS